MRVAVVAHSSSCSLGRNIKMSSFGLSFALFCVLLLGVQGQVPGFGGCPDVPVKKDFKLAQYVGKWYEVERYFPIVFELGTKCGQATYTKAANDHVTVQNKGYNRITGEVTLISGDAFAPNASVPAKLVVNFPTASTGNYWVLDTDYTSYAIVYSCSAPPFGLVHADIIWILGRKKTISADVLKGLRSKIEALGLRTKFLIDPPQTDCPFEDDDPKTELNYIEKSQENKFKVNEKVINIL